MAWKRARRRRLEGLSKACALLSCLITSVLLLEENLNSGTFCSWGLLSGVCEAKAARSRAASVRQAMVHAWAGYRLDAWGANEIHPVSRKGKFEMTGFANMSVSLIDAMSTLKLMGLDKEFDEAREFIVEHLDCDKATATVSFFETVIRVLGGLVSAYDLSGADTRLAAKATDLANRLLPVFQSSPTGLPQNRVTLPHAQPDSGNGSIGLAEMGSNVLEFASVSRITGNSSFRFLAEKGLRAVHSANEKALLLEAVDRSTGLEVGSRRHISAGTDSYYEYLLKYWLLGGKRDDHWRSRWEQAVDEILQSLILHPEGWPFSLVADLDVTSGTLSRSLHHLRCFFPGNLALGVMAGAVVGQKAQLYMELASNMTHACFQLYNQTATGLGAEQISFGQDGSIRVDAPQHVQRPEVVESLFYMWRATKEPTWRAMAWQIWQAVERYCKYPGGYTGILDVNKVPPRPDDTTQSFFFAETLKYFYLVFSPDLTLPLDAWVLNTEAHPLKVGRQQ